MLDIAFIRENQSAVRAAIQNKRFNLNLDDLIDADRARREHITKLESVRQRKNEVAQAIPKASKDDRPRLIEEGKTIKAEIERLEPILAEAQKRFDELMLRVPSVPRPEVPVGKGEEDNVEVRRVGTPRKFEFEPKDHVALATDLGLVDWDGPRKFVGRALTPSRDSARCSSSRSRGSPSIRSSRAGSSS